MDTGTFFWLSIQFYSLSFCLLLELWSSILLFLMLLLLSSLLLLNSIPFTKWCEFCSLPKGSKLRPTSTYKFIIFSSLRLGFKALFYWGQFIVAYFSPSEMSQDKLCFCLVDLKVIFCLFNIAWLLKPLLCFLTSRLLFC